MVRTGGQLLLRASMRSLDARPPDCCASLSWLKKIISLARTVLVFLRSLREAVGDLAPKGGPLIPF